VTATLAVPKLGRVNTPAVLYHYTCAEHGAVGIERDGIIKPNRHPWLRDLGPLVWLTDLDHAYAAPLGLTRYLVSCDRTAIRYPVFSSDIADLVFWPHLSGVARDRAAVARLEAPPAWPSRWWVARCVVPVPTMA
jgi:hypothetical protein